MMDQVRDIDMMDLALLLEDIETIDNEMLIKSERAASEMSGHPQHSKAVPEAEKNIDLIMQRPMLSDLIQKSMQKRDEVEKERAHKRLSLMQDRS